VAEEYLLRQNWADNTVLESFRNEVIEQIEETVAKVQREPTPDPFAEDWSALASKHLVETHNNEETPGPADI
jgi:TPP-dependent pyruvate/acetoin dehydrogenase alpha subunit